MASKRPQRADDIFDFILLEQADAADAGCSSIQTRCGVLYRDAAESKDRDLRPASFAQGGKARRWRPGSAFFFEYRSEDGEVSFLRFGAEDICDRVAGSGHQEVVSGRWLVGRELYNPAHLPRSDIIRTQMNAVGSRGKRDIRAGIDEETRRW